MIFMYILFPAKKKGKLEKQLSLLFSILKFRENDTILNVILAPIANEKKPSHKP